MRYIIIVCLFAACSKSSDNKPAPPAKPKMVLMHVYYYNGAKAHIDSVFSNTAKIAGSYSQNGSDSVASPDGTEVFLFASGEIGDRVTLIDQSGKSNYLIISNTPGFTAVNNFSSTDSFTVMVSK